MKQSIIKKLNNFFPAYPIEKAWIFGSYARGEETRDSDVDIMVEFREKHHEIEWKVIIGLRHVLVHGYHQIENEMAWEIIQNELHPLREKVQAIYDSI